MKLSSVINKLIVHKIPYSTSIGVIGKYDSVIYSKGFDCIIAVDAYCIRLWERRSQVPRDVIKRPPLFTFKTTDELISFLLLVE